MSVKLLSHHWFIIVVFTEPCHCHCLFLLKAEKLIVGAVVLLEAHQVIFLIVGMLFDWCLSFFS